MSSWLKKKTTALELYTIDVILGRRADAGAAVYGAFLELLSYLFSGIAQLRLWLYRHRILHDQPLGCLVVVVGNLTVGGTGKTPVVEKFARALQARGRKVAILSRGYKSRAAPLWRRWWWSISHTAAPPPRIVSDGARVLLDSEEAGDEPYMLARNLPGVIVLVDKNRVKAGAYAIKRFGCDTLVLDDGFQYLPLKGQLNLLLVDKTNPFGNSHLLPRGILREPIKHLRRASYVFLTKSNGERDAELEAVIERYNPGVDIIECTHQPQYLQRLDCGEEGAAPAPAANEESAPAAAAASHAISHAPEPTPLSFLKGRRVAAFCGIATPESFFKFLTDLGADLVARERFPDHYRYVQEDFVELAALAARSGAECLLTTEKDAVRIPPTHQWGCPVYYLRLEIDLLRGAADFDEAVGRICFAQD
ncbi:tetraacyldisaccharide 4'-kinase [Cephaloticoccus primus]|uniref:Tetraacyldisaccharide 4'-kinase n=1 Tax=Cephaloticoccus primus TaxID=1548207 RepID=A0A139SKP0_9BACT|nr:tetraacyldisaccharide 4'-kinase [Cephaloticoccus primus]KXU35131.1 tetraacyldisaccharide 4'-kinase [Cephaloticoccus primus]